MQSDDYLKVAQSLLTLTKGKPRQANLKRAVSSIYYALFHELAQLCSDTFIGTQKSKRSPEAYRQVYRALTHTGIKNACKNRKKMDLFPSQVQTFADVFIDFQQKRYDADYDPYSVFRKSEVEIYLLFAKAVLMLFRSVDKKDKAAFAALIMFKIRND